MAKRVYINERIFEQLSDLYDSKEEGLNRAVAGYLQIRQLTLKELRKRFTKAELIGLIDCFNGTLVEFPTIIPPKVMIEAEMEDAEALQEQSARFNYNWPVMQQKLGNLTDIEAYFLLDEIDRFWNEKEFGSPTPDLEKFMQLYADRP